MACTSGGYWIILLPPTHPPGGIVRFVEFNIGERPRLAWVVTETEETHTICRFARRHGSDQADQIWNGVRIVVRSECGGILTNVQFGFRPGTARGLNLFHAATSSGQP